MAHIGAGLAELGNYAGYYLPQIVSHPVGKTLMKEGAMYLGRKAYRKAADALFTKKYGQRKIMPGGYRSKRFVPNTSGFVSNYKRRRPGRKGRKRSKRMRLTKSLRRLREAVNMRKFVELEGQRCFTLQTSTSLPFVADGSVYGHTVSTGTTSGSCPSVVGWNEIECPNASDLKNQYATLPAISAPFGASATNTIRISDLIDTSVSLQYKFHHDLEWDIWYRNNSNITAELDFYLVKCVDATGQDPIIDLQDARASAYIKATDPTATDLPFPLYDDFNQYFTVNNFKGKRDWKIVKKVRAVLQGGDESRVVFKYKVALPVDTLELESYQKGMWGLFCRVQGTLVNDTTNPRQASISGANIAVWMNRKQSISVSRKEYDNIHRLVDFSAPTLTNGPIVGANASVQTANM